MPTKKKNAKEQRLANIEYDIGWYQIRKPIANALRKCGELGFSMAGHGCGFGGEDFSLINKSKDMYVNFCDTGNSCEVTISTVKTTDKEGYPILLFTGTTKKAMNFIENTLTASLDYGNFG